MNTEVQDMETINVYKGNNLSASQLKKKMESVKRQEEYFQFKFESDVDEMKLLDVEW